MPATANSKPFDHASLILIGLGWTIPFLQPYHRFPLAAFYSEWLAFALGLAALLLLVTRSAWREPAFPLIALLPSALALLIGLQSAFGRVPYPEQADTAVLYLLWASLLIVLGHVLVRELGAKRSVEMLAWFLFAGGLLSALAGLLQHYRPFPVPDFLVMPKVSPRVYGNLGQANHFTAYLAMALCSIGYLYGSGRLRLTWAVVGAAIMLPALALSGSRSPWLYIVLLVAWVLLLHRREPNDASRRLLVFSLGLIPGFIVAGLIAAWTGTPVTSASADPGGMVTSAQRVFESAGGLNPRIQLAAEAWQVFLSAPLFGAGFGQFAWHHFLYMAENGAVAAPGVYNHAHNLVLHLMAETGIAGALLVAGAALLWLVDLKGVKLDLEWWWMLALLGILGVHSLTEYPLWYSYFLGIAAVLLGLGARRAIRLRLSGFARLTAVLLVLAGWFSLLSVMPHYRNFERLVFTPAGKAAIVDREAFVEAIARIHSEPLLAPYVDLALATSVEINDQQLQEKLAVVARAVRFAPVSYVVQRQALLLALAGDKDAALRWLEQAARAYPEDLAEARAELGVLASRDPVKFSPLLELASFHFAEARKPPVTR